MEHASCGHRIARDGIVRGPDSLCYDWMVCMHKVMAVVVGSEYGRSGYVEHVPRNETMDCEKTGVLSSTVS